MKRKSFGIGFILWLLPLPVVAQEIPMQEMAGLKQVYGEMFQADTPLPMNDMNIELGYVLYETEIKTETDELVLAVENVRDYATVYWDGKFLGELTDEKKELAFQSGTGTHKLQFYVENIGRITYGPEILDNQKGIFGCVVLNDTEIGNWRMIPLHIRESQPDRLQFTPMVPMVEEPCFYRGMFVLDATKDAYLDFSGWSMGEIWVNEHYIGAYWEENPQQSLQVPASYLTKGENRVVVFELKKSGKQMMKLADTPVFK